jgi:Tfp pilus assembly protein PilF
MSRLDRLLAFLEHNPRNLVLRKDAISEACEAGHCDVARNLIDVGLQLYPDEPELLAHSGFVHLHAQRYVERRAICQRRFKMLLQAHPQCGRAWHSLALLDLSEMQLDAAKRHIESATRLMPEHIGTWHLLAWLELLLGDASAAEAAFQEAVAIDRNFGETHGGLAVIAALQGREQDAQASIRRALRLDPQCMSVKYAETLLLQRKGRHAEAQAVLDSVLARPVLGSDMRYRDLIAARLRQMDAREAETAAPRVYH